MKVLQAGRLGVAQESLGARKRVTVLEPRPSCSASVPSPHAMPNAKSAVMLSFVTSIHFMICPYRKFDVKSLRCRTELLPYPIRWDARHFFG